MGIPGGSAIWSQVRVLQTEKEVGGGGGVYPRDLEAVKMVVFSGKRAACREGQTWVVKDT